MTKYGKKILEIVEASRSHLTAEQVFDELRGIYLTFEHGILHANAVVEAVPGNTPQPPLSLRIFYLNIIRDQNKHVNLCLFISTEMVDRRPGPRGYSGSSTLPERGGQGPMAAFP